MDTIGEGQQKRHTKITLRPRKTITRPRKIADYLKKN